MINLYRKTANNLDNSQLKPSLFWEVHVDPGSSFLPGHTLVLFPFGKLPKRLVGPWVKVSQRGRLVYNLSAWRMTGANEMDWLCASTTGSSLVRLVLVYRDVTLSYTWSEALYTLLCSGKVRVVDHCYSFRVHLIIDLYKNEWFGLFSAECHKFLFWYMYIHVYVHVEVLDFSRMNSLYAEMFTTAVP